MTKRLKQLYDRRSALQKEMRSILTAAEADGRLALNAEEQAAYDRCEKELGTAFVAADGETPAQPATALHAEIAREQRLADYEKNVTPAVADRNAPLPPKAEGLEVKDGIAFPMLQTPKHFRGPDAKERAYKAGTWYLATVWNNERALAQCRGWGMDVRSLATQSSATPTAGGVLVPDLLLSTIIDLREQYGVFRQNAAVIPMASESVSIPRRTSGLTAYFVSDTTASTESTAGWDSVGMTAKELAVLVRYPMSLADDAVIAVADYLTNEIAYQFSVKEDQCGFIGDGTSTYGGIFGVATKINDGNHAASIYGAASGNVSFETLDLADFVGAVAKLPEYARMNQPAWYISSAGYASSMMNLMGVAGGNTVENIAGEFRRTFLGYPVVISQVLNSTLGSDVSKIKCLFGSLRLAAALGSRRDVTLTTSTERYFEYRQVAIQGTERFDINVHDVGDTSVAGPIVGLKTS
jgi:HK97 family phage major capsid protein